MTTKKQDVSASYHGTKLKRKIVGTENVFNNFHPLIPTKFEI